MRKSAFIILGLILSSSLFAQDYMKLSKDFLTAIRDGKSVDGYVKQIAEIDHDKLITQINTEDKKLAFWINVYNGLIHYKLSNNPKYYDDRGSFFSSKIIVVAGQKVSFDNLEHGILRRGTSKYSGGYFKSPFGSDWHEAFQVKKTDWRIHFALNCGAASCPPVRVYDDKAINEQLNSSAREYLTSQVSYNRTENEIFVPALMSWFRGDFGGLDGARKILIDYGFLAKDSKLEIEFNDYDWTLLLGNFYKD